MTSKTRQPDLISLTNQKITQLHDTHLQLKQTPLSERLDHLKALKSYTQKHKTLLAEAITFDMGKSILESQKEIDKSISHCDYYIKTAEEHLRPQTTKSGKFKVKSTLHPTGVIFKITPFNFPVWIPFKMLVPNIVLGNTVLIRPPETCLSIANAFEDLLKDSGLGSFDIGYTSTSDTESVIANKLVSGVSFTGSTQTGRLIGSLAGKYLKRCVLELGGSDAFIVTEHSATDKAIEDAVAGTLISKVS